jgi:hypothetical protein
MMDIRHMVATVHFLVRGICELLRDFNPRRGLEASHGPTPWFWTLGSNRW